MAKKDKKEKRNFNVLKDLKKETAYGVWGIIFFVIALFFLLAVLHVGGIVGENMVEIFSYLLGSVGYFLVPITFTILGITFFRGDPQVCPRKKCTDPGGHG